MSRKKELPGGIVVGGLFDTANTKHGPGRPADPASEYRPCGVVEFLDASGLAWRVEKAEEFLAEFPVAGGASAGEFEKVLALTQGALSGRGNERAWLMMRRLFGFMPVKVSLQDDPEQWRAWSALELCEQLGIGTEQFQAEMKALRTGVGKILASGEWRAAGGEEGINHRDTENTERKDGLGEVLLDTPVELLTRHGYSARMFEANVPVRVEDERGRESWKHAPRPKEENDAEMKWFCARLQEVEKLLARPMTAQLARNLLMHELRMRRAQVDLFKYGAGTAEYERARGEHDNAERSHRETVGQIDEVAPWFNPGAKEVGLTASVGDIVKGIQQYQARGDRKLIDGIFTAAGIQVQLRTSKQFPEPKYRLGWNLYVLEARKGIWDPNWKSELKERDLKKLDRGFKNGVLAVMEESGEEPIDLVKDEFEDLGPGESAGESMSEEGRVESGEQGRGRD